MFLAVAECGSFSEAAKRLFVSHSTTSRAVAALEAELGTTLLHRSSRSVTLTPAGEVLVERAKDLLRQAEAIKQAVQNTSVS